ncbi:hypothetical protein CW702_02530 [Candidatus Bathyarchaeota archaeon]|nr:MAG: hypothetical protein CW702_02530 [Candidatus Bathyarchaeota archaeon]
MNASPRILDHYIVECERYEATLRVYLLIFEALGRYREAVENSKQKNKEKAVHKLNSAISAVEEALETQENMMLNIEKTKAHYLIPQTMRDLTFMRTFLKNLLNKLYDYKDRYIQGEIHELPKINLAS